MPLKGPRLPPDQIRDKLVAVRVSGILKQKLETAANKNDQTMNRLIRRILTQWVDQNPANCTESGQPHPADTAAG